MERDPPAEVRLGEEEMCQASEAADELWDGHAAEVVERQIQVPQMS